MIDKDKLVAIREGFRLNYKGFAMVPHLEAPPALEIDPYTAAIGCLVTLVFENVADDFHKAKQWLIAVVFNYGKTTVFLTVKDVYIHVMTALDTIIALQRAA